MNRLSVSATIAILSSAAASALAQPAKNVIYMIGDGMGFNTLAASGYYNSGNNNSQIFRGPGWSSSAMSTYPLRTAGTPGSTAQDPNTVYSSAKSWDTSPTAGSLEFAGYQWNNATAPDSANTIASSMTGVKTYNNAVNVDGAGNALPTFAKLASQNLNMRTGIVSTVQWADATPAAFSGVSNVSRANRTQIADDILSSPYIDVVMGAGNPDYNNDGALNGAPNNAWVSSSTWNDLKDGNNSGFSANWELHQDRADFENLANGTLSPTKKFLGMVKSFDGKQQYRSADGGLTTNYTTHPNLNKRTDVPELNTMVSGALRLLENPSRGFFLGIEQGEIDRAMHSNHLGRMIEAQQEFETAISSVDAYLTANAGDPTKANYSNTLLIVTADHDHLLMGADSNTVPFQEPINNGLGSLPGSLFQTGSHSNQLVPIFGKGIGSDLLAQYANQFDFYSDGANTFGRGSYLDQAELFNIFMTASAVPEPSALAALLLAGCTMLRRRSA